MEKGLVFRIGKILQDKSELVVGKYYHFYNEVYLYCGNIEPFKNAHAFVCVAGTLYVNDATLKELLESKELRCAIKAKEETAKKVINSMELNE